MWHWERITQEPYKGGWTHRYFVRGRKSLCNLMSRHCTPERETYPIESCSVDEHSSLNTEASDFAVRRELVDMQYLPPSLPNIEHRVSVESLDDFHTPAWEKLFDTLCNDDSEEHAQHTQQHQQHQDGWNSDKIFYAHQNMDALYDSMFPTAIVEPDYIIEPTPLKEEPKLHFVQPLSMTEQLWMQTMFFSS